jgi:hypothetical protein
MAPKRNGKKEKVGRPRVGTKTFVVSARVTEEMRKQLYAAAARNRRKIGREIAARLDYSLARYRKGLKSGHVPKPVGALQDLIAIAVREIEAETGMQWNADRYSFEHLIKAIGGAMMGRFLPLGKAVIPRKVLERAKTHSAGNAYPTHLGEEVTQVIIGWFRIAEHTRREVDSAKGQWPFPEFLMEFERIERDLKPRRVK